MNKIFRFWLFAATVAAFVVLTSCGKDDTVETKNSGIKNPGWSQTETVPKDGKSLSFTFTASGDWTAESNAPAWCTVTTPSGKSGAGVLRITVNPNPTGGNRSADVSVSVSGFSPAKFSVVQLGADGPDADINAWMANYMETNYLWNSAVKKLQFNYTLGYEDFLDKVLADVAAQNDINHDDGHWENGKRSYFYSNIQRFKASTAEMTTRGTRKTDDGTGIQFMYVDIVGATYYFVLLAVSPGSPAANAGLKRGSIISKVNGQSVTSANYLTLVNSLTTSSGSVRITPATVSGGKLVDQAPITVAAATYNDNPVWVKKTLTAANGDKVAYLCYKSFNLYYDSQLISTFSNEFKGAKQLIIDLRYNGGGHVVSSAVLGTLVAGNAKKDQIYSHTTYNQDRTAAGEKGDDYKIGNATVGNSSYSPIATALSSALNLNTVYVLGTTNTASASELVINGLRGLDIDVRLIGTTTNGKNVGMEPITKIKDGYEYDFSPITFYSANAKGYKDYSNGFTPDVKVDEYEYDFYDWGDSQDPLVKAAMQWINSGTKPAKAAVSATRADREILTVPMRRGPLDGAIALRGLDE